MCGKGITVNTFCMKWKLLLLTAAAVGTSLWACATITPPNTGEESAKKADLIGGVYNNDTKKPVGNVTVTATNLASKKEKAVVTDNDGNYTFTDLEAGHYKFVFVKSGYKKVIKDKIYIRQDEAFQIDVAMTPHTTYDFLPGPFSFSEY